MGVDFYRQVLSQLAENSVTIWSIVSGVYAGSRRLQSGSKSFLMGKASEHFWQQALENDNKSNMQELVTFEGNIIFREMLQQEPTLIICGGGHISLELAALSDYMEYSYIILDDREEFANTDRFLRAARCICEPFESITEKYHFQGNPYFIIVTRGHAYDMQCLEWALKEPFQYIGMIGSRGKVDKTMKALLAKGYEESLLAKVHAPIGLPIGGQTPKEIAISIMAQVIQTVNRQQNIIYLNPQIKAAMADKRGYVLAEIVEKKGSAPREAGTKMLIDPDGIFCGTVGGGNIEYEVERDAKELLKNGEHLYKTYILRNDAAGDLGMWCGGEVSIFLQVFQ